MKFAMFHRLHGVRPLRHCTARRISAGWYSLEVGSWTIEVEVDEKMEDHFRAVASSTPVSLASALCAALPLPSAGTATMCVAFLTCWLLYVI